MGPTLVSYTERKGSYAFGNANYIIFTKKEKKSVLQIQKFLSYFLGSYL